MSHIKGLSTEQLAGVFAIMPTPATGAGASPNSVFTVDLDESARAARALVGDGVDGIMLNGTFGEAAALTDAEWRAFTATIVEAVAGLVPVLAGTTTLNTRDTIERTRWAAALGASGVLLGRPMWNPLCDTGIVDYYRAVAEAVPGTGIVVYNNRFAFKGRIGLGAWEQLAAIPQVVGAKYGMVDAEYGAVHEAVAGRICLMPIDVDWPKACMAAPPGPAACWSGSASCHPAPALRMRDLVQSGNLEGAATLADAMRASYDPLFPNGDQENFRIYNVPIEKTRINAAGYMVAGPARAPYHFIPTDWHKIASASGEEWRRLADDILAGRRHNLPATSQDPVSA